MHDVDIQLILFELFTGSIKSFGTLYCLTCDEGVKHHNPNLN
jgi:hypothetical protein